uniref:Uncharacterized protein n=1 Tax=Romanomermis culicivorax TaxID=13658 RepID=A0A915L7W8_ROMCU
MESCKAHKTCMMDELHTQCTLLPSRYGTEWGKTLSKWTTRPHEQWAKQKEGQRAGQTSSSAGVTGQPKVMLTKHSGTQMKTAQGAVQPQQMPPAYHSDSHQSCHESHQCDNCHHQERDHFLHRDNAIQDSHDHDHGGDAPHHQTQKEQTQQ